MNGLPFSGRPSFSIEAKDPCILVRAVAVGTNWCILRPCVIAIQGYLLWCLRSPSQRRPKVPQMRLSAARPAIVLVPEKFDQPVQIFI